MMTMESWRKEPWRCPACGAEDVMMRNMLVPGGPPDDIRREADATWECACVKCTAQWHVTFVPQSFHIEVEIEGEVGS